MRPMCKSCRYVSGYGSGKTSNHSSIHCGYALKTGATALKRDGKGGVVDTRGEDKRQCKLYKEDE